MKLSKKIQDSYYRSEAVKDFVIISDLENIADEQAIGFTEWIPYNAYKESTCWRMYDKKDNEYTIQELIHEYKKQLGL